MTVKSAPLHIRLKDCSQRAVADEQQMQIRLFLSGQIERCDECVEPFDIDHPPDPQQQAAIGWQRKFLSSDPCVAGKEESVVHALIDRVNS